MTQSGPLFDQAGSDRDTRAAADAAPVWLQRLSLVILVMFCLLIGNLLAVLPWSPRFWDHNAWLLAHPAVFNVLRTGWARGILSGIGLLDVWIGISEALHYRDFRPSQGNPHGR